MQRLNGKPPLTFLVRLSQTSLAISAVTKDGQARHTLISHSSVGFVFAGQATDKVQPFESVSDLIRYLVKAGALKYVLDKRSFSQ